MKKDTVILFLLFVFFSIGCYAQKSTIQKNETIAIEFIETLSSHNMEKFVSLFDENCTYVEVCTGRVYSGKEAIKNYIQATIDGIPDSKFEIVTVLANADYASVEWIWKGTNTVGWPAMGIPATNKLMELKGASVMNIANGKIKNNRDYWDWNSFLKEIGVITN